MSHSWSCTESSDQTDHDYVQMYMHPKPSGYSLKFIVRVLYLMITADCNQSATDEPNKPVEENHQGIIEPVCI